MTDCPRPGDGTSPCELAARRPGAEARHARDGAAPLHPSRRATRPPATWDAPSKPPTDLGAPVTDRKAPPV